METLSVAPKSAVILRLPFLSRKSKRSLTPPIGQGCDEDHKVFREASPFSSFQQARIQLPNATESVGSGISLSPCEAT